MRNRFLSIGLAMLLVTTTSLSVVAQSSNSQAQNDNKKPLNVTQLEKQRLAAEERVNEPLTPAREAQIKNKCEQAQNRIQNVATRQTKFQNQHSEIYNGWYTKLVELLTRLESTPGVDATQLRADIEGLDDLITELQAGFADYETEIGAMLELGGDCAAEPQSFQNSLLMARDLRQAIVEAMHSVKDYIRTTIKDELKTIKDQLADDTDTGSDGEEQ